MRFHARSVRFSAVLGPYQSFDNAAPTVIPTLNVKKQIAEMYIDWTKKLNAFIENQALSVISKVRYGKGFLFLLISGELFPS